jgi:hypothetical protein
VKQTLARPDILGALSRTACPALCTGRHNAGAPIMDKDCVMQPERSLRPEVLMSAFRVQPDWYEDYWLRSKKAPPPVARRWRRRDLLLRSFCCAAFVAMLVYFGH